MRPGHCRGLLPLVFAGALAFGQSPTGEIAGAVYDASGSVVSNASIIVRSAATAFERALRSNQAGQYSVASLAAGTYEIRAEASGFRALEVAVVVSTGAVTTADLHLQLGEQKDTLTVAATEQLIDVERHTLDHVVNRKQIQELPLNGRSFLQLAFLSPGVTLYSSTQGIFNSPIEVAVLGGNPDLTRITVDGASVNDIVTGGTEQNFSQEIVQEFQISSVNFDLATGIAAGGAINIVTRTGGNRLHGSGFFFFRDHHMAAYPGLNRDPLAPDPFFARRQSGLWLGGPIVKDRFFFFAAYEHNNQSGVFTSVPSDPAFSSLERVTSSPKHDNLVNARLDYRISSGNTAFIRFSHDGNNTFTPVDINALPSTWESIVNWADSGVFSLISGLRPSLVNEFRYSNTFWRNKIDSPTASQCPDCLGLGGPSVVVEGAGVLFGNENASPQTRLTRSNMFADNVTWQRGAHRMKWGGEVEFWKGAGAGPLYAPAEMWLFSPQEVRQLAPPLAALLPTTFKTLNDVLALPLKNFVFGVGDINQPPSFHHDQADHDRFFHVYWQDTWKLDPRFTFNYGLAWSFESNALNHDLTKPQLLAPIFGADGLAHEKHAWLHLTPAAGFAWALPGSKTVVRGGGGIFYDSIRLDDRLRERAYLGPLGTGFLILPGSTVPNPIPGIPGLPVGDPLDLRVPTAFSGGLLEAILPQVRAGAIQTLHVNPDNTDLSIRNIDVFKTGEGLFVTDFVPAHAQHLSIGVERQVTSNFAVTADFAFRHFIHETLRGVDLNHYNSAAGPVMPQCSAATAQAPGVVCSNGPIQATISGGNGTYKGLLVRADKRFSHRHSIQVSYALQSDINIYGLQKYYYTPITNLNNWLQNTGPSSPRHVLNVSGLVELPGGVQVSFISSFNSKPPFQPVITGADFYGTGTDEFLLPGSGTNRFNFGLGKSDLARLVNQYNSAYAGKKGPNPGQVFPTVALPQNYSLGRVFNSQDVRVTKTFRFGERFQWQAFGEAFNLLNTANLSGYSENLLDPGFGQPTARFSSIFGTGGPRSFQLGTRLSF